MLSEVVNDLNMFVLLGNNEIFNELNMESSLGEVKTGYIRFYTVISSKNNITTTEKESLLKACGYEAFTGSCMIESSQVNSNYALLCLGVHYNNAPQEVIDNIIVTANGTKPFLRFHSLITNIYRPTELEIKDYLRSFD